jgi:SanA protein
MVICCVSLALIFFIAYRWVRRILWIGAIAVALLITCLVWSYTAIRDAAVGKLYSDVNAVPHMHCGLLLGTSPHNSEGAPNHYYTLRLAAAKALLDAHRIDHLIISGDNRTSHYNEPEHMFRDLRAMGVDSAKMTLDFAGFRTFDSVVRAKEVFGQDSLVIISQAFHNERALFIAAHHGLVAVGFNAADPDQPRIYTQWIREAPARCKVYLDEWFDTQPHFLGEPVAVP